VAPHEPIGQAVHSIDAGDVEYVRYGHAVQFTVPVVLLKYPAGHAVQSMSPLSEKVPTGHATHCAPFGTVPAGQVEQLAAPAGELVPAGQSVHAVSPPSENVPAGQRPHCVAPISAVYAPGSHGVQDADCAWDANAPGLHCVHADELTPAYVPGAQAVWLA